MGTYKKYKNFMEKYLDSNSGRRFFNVVYSVGAAVVILGAMFKLLHLPFGNQMLMIGMITEAIVFLLSAFEKPAKEYKWEEVFTELAEDENFIPKAERVRQAQSNRPSPAIQSTATPSSRAGLNRNDNNTNVGSGASDTTINTVGASSAVGSNNSTQPRGEGTVSGLSGNITIIGGSGGSSVSSTNNTEFSDHQVEQLSSMSNNMEKFAKVTESLAKISDSFQSIIDSSDGIGNNTRGYVSQMEALNKNIAGLNTIYEVQLKGVSSQINAIEEINAGLDRIKTLYSGSLVDSSLFKNETEKMAKQLTELNQVYARLLQAMTTNMNLGTGFNPNMGNTNTP